MCIRDRVAYLLVSLDSGVRRHSFPGHRSARAGALHSPPHLVAIDAGQKARGCRLDSVLMRRLVPVSYTHLFQDFHALPEDRQRMVRKAFRDLREYPPEQRQALMNAGQFQAQFTPQERSILGNILAVEPYHPTPRSGLDNDGLQYGH